MAVKPRLHSLSFGFVSIRNVLMCHFFSLGRGIFQVWADRHRFVMVDGDLQALRCTRD